MRSTDDNEVSTLPATRIEDEDGDARHRLPWIEIR